MFRTPYDGSAKRVSDATGTRNELPSRTVQSQKDDADINVLVRRFGLSGVMPASPQLPRFEDFGDVVFDFRSAQQAVRDAQEAFNELPASVRREFGNDPQALLAFCSREENLPRMRELGLAKPEEPKAPEVVQKVEVVQVVDGEVRAVPREPPKGG